MSHVLIKIKLTVNTAANNNFITSAQTKVDMGNKAANTGDEYNYI